MMLPPLQSPRSASRCSPAPGLRKFSLFVGTRCAWTPGWRGCQIQRPGVARCFSTHQRWRVLNALPRIEGSDFVIVGRKPGQHLTLWGLERAWQRIRRLAKLDDVRLHDLRHSFASIGAASGDSLLVIGTLLGHTRIGTTQRYAHLSNDPVRAAAARIGQTNPVGNG